MDQTTIVAIPPTERVAAMIREYLRSAEVTDVFGPDEATGRAAFDFDERFYTPLEIRRACRPFDPELPGVPSFRDVLLDGVRDLRRIIDERRLTPQDLKAYLPRAGEPLGALVYFRPDRIVFAARAVPVPLPGDEVGDGTGMPWQLTVAVSVDDEAWPGD
jgi:hypothetical protein